jgi:hypothetical protein
MLTYHEHSSEFDCLQKLGKGSKSLLKLSPSDPVMKKQGGLKSFRTHMSP